MAISVTQEGLTHIGAKKKVWGSFTGATGGDDSNSITTGLSSIIACGVALSTEAWAPRISESGGTMTLYIGGATGSDTCSGTYWAEGS